MNILPKTVVIATLFSACMIPEFIIAQEKSGSNSKTQVEKAPTGATYKNPKAPIENRVNDLLKRMTLQEKIAQLTEMSVDELKQENMVKTNSLNFDKLQSGIGCIEGFTLSGKQYAERIKEIQTFLMNETRLGIPAIPISEALHGWVQDGATIFPQAIGMGATFNPALINEVGIAIRNEIKPTGVKQALYPDLDLAQDPRWGRVEETYGEDPFLVSQLGIAMIKGFQEGRNNAEDGYLICTAKHFYGHNGPISGLNLASTAGGNYDLFNTHLKSFEAAVKKANLLSIMSSYNSYDGIPTNVNKYMFTEVLRNKWGFKGYVYSDWGAVGMLRGFHHFTPSRAEAGKYALEAGIDLEAPGPECFQYLDSLVKAGKVSEKTIDKAVFRILYTKFKAGLFENPYPDIQKIDENMHHPSHIALSRKVAEESIVLLRNKDHFLPLDKSKIRSIAVVGPNADQVQFGDYSWSRNNKDGITVLQGIKEIAGDQLRVNYAKGCDLVSLDKSQIEKAVETVSQSDIAVVVIGTASASLSRDYSNATCGEGYDVSDIEPSGVQSDLVEAVIATGKPVIVVLVTGRPLAVTSFNEKIPALLCAWYPGEEGGRAIADILFGNVNPSAKSPVSFPRSTGHIPSYYNKLVSDRGYYRNPGSYGKPGRDYVFSAPTSLYPFGHGLSYTSFTISPANINKVYSTKDTIKVTVNISNTGDLDGAEVVQAYVNRNYAPVVTPVKELKAFQKVLVKKGASQSIQLQIPVQDLLIYDNTGQPIPLAGSYRISIGTSSEDLPFKHEFEVKGESKK